MDGDPFHFETKTGVARYCLTNNDHNSVQTSEMKHFQQFVNLLAKKKKKGFACLPLLHVIFFRNKYAAPVEANVKEDCTRENKGNCK